MDREDSIRKLGELIKGIRIGMLTTVGEGGMLYSRPMAVQQRDFDGDLWFFTNDDSPKAKELMHDKHVNLSLADAENHRYVSISGMATVVHDREKSEELWSPMYLAWFPEGLKDPRLALIKVKVMSAEYWDAPAGPVQRLVDLARTFVGGEHYRGENQKLAI